MTSLMKANKVLVLVTFFLGLSALGFFGFYRSTQLPQPVAFEPQGFPTFGNHKAKLKIVSFEDFRCHNCRRFHEKVFSQIRTHYIDSGKAHYTLIPLAYLKGSKPLANAALAVYESSPEKFLSFAGKLFDRFKEEEASQEKLIAVAESVGGIDLAYLKRAIQEELFYQKLEKTLIWAKEIMQEDFGVPTLYINGIHAPTGSFQAIQRRIERIER